MRVFAFGWLFRDSSDPLRSRNSKITQMRIARDRIGQLEEKEQEYQRQLEEEKRYAEEVERQVQEKLRREQEEAEQRKRMQEQTVAEVDAQVALRKRVMEEEEERKREHEAQLLEQWHREKEAEEAQQQRQRELAHREYLRTLEANRIFQAEKDKIAKKVRECSCSFPVARGSTWLTAVSSCAAGI